MSEEKTYQPGWGEKKEHTHHHHHSLSKERNRRIGGALRMRDKQAYYGLMLLIVSVSLYGFYRVGKLAYDELRDMPFGDPAMEMQVDELRIRKVAEQDALMMGDSLAQEYRLDSMQRQVQIETVPVYRPPVRENKWYITKRDWKALKRNYELYKWYKNKEKES